MGQRKSLSWRYKFGHHEMLMATETLDLEENAQEKIVKKRSRVGPRRTLTLSGQVKEDKSTKETEETTRDMKTNQKNKEEAYYQK